MNARVLLADDHALVRAGIRALVEGMQGVSVVGEAGSAAEAVRSAAELRPDLAILDISMPGGSGLGAAEAIRDASPGTRVLILSMFAGEEYVNRALRAGARGYLLKDSAAAELELALRAVIAGEVYLSPAVSRTVVDGYVRAQEQEALALTPRQTEVLTLLASGLAAKEIAHRLGLSVKTVESHRAQIMERLGIRDLAGLVRYAVRVGLVTSEE